MESKYIIQLKSGARIVELPGMEPQLVDLWEDCTVAGDPKIMFQRMREQYPKLTYRLIEVYSGV